MNWPRLGVGLLAVGVLTLLGCARFQQVMPVVGEGHRLRNEGYSLLYELTGKQSDVDKVLIVKKTSPQVAAEIHAIAKLFVGAKEQFDLIAKHDGSLRLKLKPLPTMEQETRAAIERTTTKDLLLMSGPEFEQRLLLTQAEALNYAAHLAQRVAEREKDEERKKFLVRFAEQCTEHCRHVRQLLASLPGK